MQFRLYFCRIPPLGKSSTTSRTDVDFPPARKGFSVDETDGTFVMHTSAFGCGDSTSSGFGYNLREANPGCVLLTGGELSYL